MKFFETRTGKKLSRARWATLGLASLLAAGIPARAQSANDVMQNVKFDQRINEPLPLDATFRDSTGRTVALGDYFGRRPVILALVYYECPMLCTFVLNGTVKALRTLQFDAGREFDVVVISFNPKETPELAAEKKATYLEEYGRPGAAAGWHFLTGDADSIAKVTEAAGFHYIYDAESGQFAHASGLMVVTPEGKLFRYFYGIDYPPRDLRLALVEASKNQIGTPVDQVLLYCFHYDPKTGKYGVLITRVLRLAGSGFVLVMGSLVFIWLRRERKARHGEKAAPGVPPLRETTAQGKETSL